MSYDPFYPVFNIASQGDRLLCKPPSSISFKNQDAAAIFLRHRSPEWKLWSSMDLSFGDQIIEMTYVSHYHWPTAPFDPLISRSAANCIASVPESNYQRPQRPVFVPWKWSRMNRKVQFLVRCRGLEGPCSHLFKPRDFPWVQHFFFIIITTTITISHSNNTINQLTFSV